MAFSEIDSVAIRGIAACVPENVEENEDSLPVFKAGEAARVVAQTGIRRRHVIPQGSGMTVSDLCVRAFEELLQRLGWERESISLLVFVASTGDYITPSTSNVLHGRLGLSEDCLCFDIRQGCPGWVVGMDAVSSMVSTGHFKRAILLCGDASTLMCSPLDKETRPLFSDAGTVTALEYDPSAPAMEFHHGSRGTDYKAIITPAGGLRQPPTPESLEFKSYGEHLVRRDIDCTMDGMAVFGFGLQMAPKSLNALMEHFQINDEDVDVYLFHQANQYMNNKILKKLRLNIEKVPFSLSDFGNTSCAGIPLTLVYKKNQEYSSRAMNTLACTFGVGLAWASVHFRTDKIVCPPVFYYKS